MADLGFNIVEISAEQASFSYDASLIDSTVPSSFHGDIIGQPRAVKAIEMGISIPGKGYNIFVTGEPGTGRTTAIKKIIRDQQFQPQRLHDIAYIHNFIKPEAPIALQLSPGEGRKLVLMMKDVVRHIQEYLIEKINDGEKHIDEQQLLEAALPAIDATAESFSDPKITLYLDQVKIDITSFAYLFNGVSADMIRSTSFFSRYTVNLLIDHAQTTENPAVFEMHPTFSNLLGSIDSRSDQNEENLPFLSIHGGSLLESSGGWLIINAEDLLKEESLWDRIKQILKTSRLYPQNPSSSSHSGGIRPEPIDVDLKLIALGSEELYDILFNEDPDFYKLFKVSAEFDFSMPATRRNIGNYIGFINMITAEEQLLPVDTSGIAEILRFGSYLVEQRNELSTQFSLIADLLREATYHAKKAALPSINAEMILKTREERDYLASLSESKIVEQIISGEMLLHLEGSKIGMVNALAVLDRGYYSFGIPAVISATVAPGTEGIVNIEHEAGLSGEIHDKGLLILEGYLRKMYARNFPLSIYSGICFEQSYAEVDGDSASSSELYALLSAIGNLPIKQDVAVTGSVNQMGEIQPVGGINEKIIGFFSICDKNGLTGHQGVLIPKKNIKNLILPQKVLDALAAKKFHIYPVSTIDEGMQILSHRKAGIRSSKGLFPPNTFNRIIEDSLKHLSSLSRQNS
ncbi:MAG: AAA family ATPase [Spirochaetia bacterium]|nr:AAA family ATPase [Spirochaetia bacterium]MCF7940867.1 AAA family ATPase [Spirochaetia bacterium]